MDRKEFEEEVRRRAPQLAANSLEVSIRHYVEDRNPNRMDKEAVGLCIQLAGRIQQESSNVAQTPTATQVIALPPTPAASIGNHLLALKILPQIQEVRQKIFGRADPPFLRWDDAEGWLTEASERQVFKRCCQELAGATGFSSREIERYVLIGVEPYLSHVEVALQSFAYHTRGQISLDWSFTDKDLRMAGRAVRTVLGVSRLKGITTSDQRLLELMNQIGPPPPKGSKGQKDYWERLRLMWNADKRNTPYPPVSALKRKYARLLDKLNRLMPLHPMTSATLSNET